VRSSTTKGWTIARERWTPTHTSVGCTAPTTSWTTSKQQPGGVNTVLASPTTPKEGNMTEWKCRYCGNKCNHAADKYAAPRICATCYCTPRHHAEGSDIARALDTHSAYHEGVITAPAETLSGTYSNFARVGDRWAAVHGPHPENRSYGVRWWEPENSMRIKGIRITTRRR